MSKRLFTDSDLVAATGLHMDNIRKLVTWGAVKPAEGGKGRGKVRLWDRKTAKHVACVAAVMNAGQSLRMAHTLVYLDLLNDLFLDFVDPDFLAMNAGDTFGWFDPSKPLKPEDEHDFKLYIADGQYVYMGSLSDDPPIPKGLLVNGGTLFRTYMDFSEFMSSVSDGKAVSTHAKWEPVPGRFEIDPASLAWEYDETLKDDVAVDWRGAFAAAVSITQINLSFAAKIAMRRLLDIPVFFETQGQD